MATRSSPTESSVASRQGVLQDGRRQDRSRQSRSPGTAGRNSGLELGSALPSSPETFDKKIAEHQTVIFRLVDMTPKVEAAHPDDGVRRPQEGFGPAHDVEAGKAKYLASGYRSHVEDSFRIPGGYGLSKECQIERPWREAPMLLLGKHPQYDHRPPHPRRLQDLGLSLPKPRASAMTPLSVRPCGSSTCCSAKPIAGLSRAAANHQGPSDLEG
jgi:hypothetical protein